MSLVLLIAGLLIGGLLALIWGEYRRRVIKGEMLKDEAEERKTREKINSILDPVARSSAIDDTGRAALEQWRKHHS